jgi:hypothetical protein
MFPYSKHFSFSSCLLFLFWCAVAEAGIIQRFASEHISTKVQQNGTENFPIATCAGKWIEHEHVPLINQHILHINRSFDSFKSADEILTEICQSETLYHNCFYHGITNRTNKILKRGWHTNDSECGHPYFPKNFLEKLRNQHLYFFGDSTMLQTWKYLTCSLLSATSSNESDIQWLHHKGGSLEVSNIYNAKTCPFGGPHCLIHSHGHIYFNEYNLNMSYSGITNYDRLELQRLIKLFKIDENGIVIFNFGIHFNLDKYFGANAFTDTLNLFLYDFYNDIKTPVKPKLFFQESMPQHFTRSTAQNGYFNQYEAATWCDPIRNMTGECHLISA